MIFIFHFPICQEKPEYNLSKLLYFPVHSPFSKEDNLEVYFNEKSVFLLRGREGIYDNIIGSYSEILLQYITEFVLILGLKSALCSCHNPPSWYFINPEYFNL